MTATTQAILPAPLHYRNLQWAKNVAVKESQSFETSLSLGPVARQELEWWLKEVPKWNGRSIAMKNPALVIETDASLLGWGARAGDESTGDMWSPQERMSHINVLELVGGTFAVQAFARNLRNAYVKLRMDNRSAVAYVNHMGGTKSPCLASYARQLWSWCIDRGITLTAEYFPGSDNEFADAESRTLMCSGEWMLCSGHWTRSGVP